MLYTVYLMGLPGSNVNVVTVHKPCCWFILYIWLLHVKLHKDLKAKVYCSFWPSFLWVIQLYKLIDESWEHDDITTVKSHRATNKQSEDQMGCKETNSLCILYKILYLEVKLKMSTHEVLLIFLYCTGKLWVLPGPQSVNCHGCLRNNGITLF